jgi:DNA-binding NarL/FixJ family response regulator
MIRVLVIADSAIARAGLEAIVREDPRFRVVGSDQPANGRAIPVSDLRADVVLAEVASKRRLNAISAQFSNGTPLVLLVDDITRGDLLRALNSGARGILRREAAPAEIFAAIEAAAAGLTAIGTEDLELLLPAASPNDEEDGPVEALSAREAEVLALMAQGLANKDIAGRLNISEHTVKFHVSSILAKLGATSRTEAVTRGLRDGMVIL